MGDRTQKTPHHHPHLRVVMGSSATSETDTEEDPAKRPRHPIVEMILEELCDAIVAGTTSEDPVEARRIAIHRAYAMLFATWPKGSGL